jgi:hypothetical protein
MCGHRHGGHGGHTGGPDLVETNPNREFRFHTVPPFINLGDFPRSESCFSDLAKNGIGIVARIRRASADHAKALWGSLLSYAPIGNQRSRRFASHLDSKPHKQKAASTTLGLWQAAMVR